jgi:hypothetical protein
VHIQQRALERAKQLIEAEQAEILAFALAGETTLLSLKLPKHPGDVSSGSSSAEILIRRTLY